MNLKIKPFVPRSVTIASLVVLMSLMMFNADYLFHKAFAFSVTEFVGVNDTGSVVRVGSQTWVFSTTADDNIKIYVSGAVVATVSVTDPLRASVFNNRVYVYTFASTVIEFEPNTITYTPNQLRTSSGLACGTTVDSAYFASDGTFWCATPTSDVIKKLDLTTFTITASTTTNTGADACDNPTNITYDPASDTVFAPCDTTNNIVAIQAPMTSGTPDYGVAKTVTTNTSIAFDPDTNNLFVGGGGVTPTLYAVVLGTSITATISYTGLGTSGGDAILDLNGHFIWGDDTGDVVRIIDSGNGDVMLSASITTVNGGTAITTLYAYSSLLVYIGNVGSSSQNWAVMDLTGVASGSGAGGIISASVCYVDKNFDGVADYIFNDVGGPDGFPTVGHPDAGVPDGMCDWSGFGTTSPPPITDTGGGLACLTGIIPCTNGQPTDPDPQTNGIGYLLVIFLLAIMILLFGVAQMKLGLGIPDWLWMIGTFAVIGFATLIGWIDSTLFIIGAVIVAALGAVSFIKKFAGGF